MRFASRADPIFAKSPCGSIAMHKKRSYDAHLQRFVLSARPLASLSPSPLQPNGLGIGAGLDKFVANLTLLKTALCYHFGNNKRDRK